MEIRVLGPGCAKCRTLFVEVQKAVAASGVEAEVEKVEKLDEIISYGVAMTPGLVIDGVVKSSGRLPRRDEIVDWLTEAAEARP